jgi:hypothetical protein
MRLEPEMPLPGEAFGYGLNFSAVAHAPWAAVRAPAVAPPASVMSFRLLIVRPCGFGASRKP